MNSWKHHIVHFFVFARGKNVHKTGNVEISIPSLLALVAREDVSCLLLLCRIYWAFYCLYESLVHSWIWKVVLHSICFCDTPPVRLFVGYVSGFFGAIN